MKIAATGFVSLQAGSVASANALLLGALLDAGHTVDFFSKPSFVDPRPAVGERPRFRFVPVVNGWQDRLRARTSRLPAIGFLTTRLDASSYNRLLIRSIREENSRTPYDLVLWMGDYAQDTVPGVASVSFAQGPPGTDARSILRHRAEIFQLAGKGTAWKWLVLAQLRLSPIGLPPLGNSDHIIVGSSVSCESLENLYGLPSSSLSTLPYPIDLDLFRPIDAAPATDSALRVIWLGRIIPRKRLDLFLNGIATAIRRGFDLQATLVGQCDFLPGYEKWIRNFPFPQNLRWVRKIPRDDVPALLREHDVLLQPSDEENFGSSVAEAQACGLAAIVGQTNGNRDYLCERDIHLPDDRPESLADALGALLKRKREKPDAQAERMISRRFAEERFSLPRVATELEAILESARKKIGPGAKKS